MSKSKNESRGVFYWYELFTPDTKAAIDFYTHVVGWKVQPFGDESNPYRMWVAGEEPMGGVFALSDEMKAMGAHPHWMAHVTVPDVDATAKQVEKLGGRILVPPMDVPSIGRFTTFMDPQGAAISAFTPLEHPAGDEPSGNGHISWRELATTDARAAETFYEAVFGWEIGERMDMGSDGMYDMYRRKGSERSLGGIFKKPEGMPVSAWLYYISIPDINGGIERVKAAGGQVVHGPHQVPGGDWIAQCMDPQGAMFALHANR